MSSAATATTALFVPGDRPERFAKALASGADVVIVDLEDAVAPPAKRDALDATVAALSSGIAREQILVRINPLDSPTTASEIEALVGPERSASAPLGLVIPKAEDTPDLRNLASRCDELGLAVVALVESAKGLVDAPALATIPGVTRLAFGAVDFSLDIDASQQDRFLDHARSILVLVSRAAGIAPPLDSPSLEIANGELISASARLARDFGFGGKLCIHPAQVSAIAAAFLPSADEVAWARSVVAAEEGASQIDGRMVDRPVILRAQRIITRSEGGR